MHWRIPRSPAVLFAWGAVILAINGMAFFHSDWPPTSWPKVTFTAGNFGEELLFCAAIFACIGLLYYGFSRLTRLQMKPVLGYIHFAISAAAVPVLIFLDYWFSVTYKEVPGEGFWPAVARGVSASVQADVWAFWVFALAQLAFLGNISWAFVKRLRSKHPQLK